MEFIFCSSLILGLSPSWMLNFSVLLQKELCVPSFCFLIIFVVVFKMWHYCLGWPQMCDPPVSASESCITALYHCDRLPFYTFLAFKAFMSNL